MRRILSILMLLVLTLGPAFPAGGLTLAQGLASGWTGKVDESRLPACCRRNGRHHCEMGSEASQAYPHGTTIAANKSCPCMPHALVSAVSSAVALVSPHIASTSFASASFLLHDGYAAARMTDRRNWPMRGPPASQTL